MVPRDFLNGVLCIQSDTATNAVLGSPIPVGPLLGSLGVRPALRHHTQSAFVEVEQGLLFVVLLFVQSSDLDDLAHDFRLDPAAFGFGVDFLDIFAERALLIFEPLNALDKRFELRARDAPDCNIIARSWNSR